MRGRYEHCFYKEFEIRSVLFCSKNSKLQLQKSEMGTSQRKERAIGSSSDRHSVQDLDEVDDLGGNL